MTSQRKFYDEIWALYLAAREEHGEDSPLANLLLQAASEAAKTAAS